MCHSLAQEQGVQYEFGDTLVLPFRCDFHLSFRYSNEGYTTMLRAAEGN